MLGYFMIGVEMIAEAVEDPFGTDEDDIMLDKLCEGIERSVSGIFQFADTAPPLVVGSKPAPGAL
jgi:predicted membrane chloride channel (bestrophin family)